MIENEPRRQFRQVLAGSTCVSPASVFDPLSARIATQVGFRIGMFAGSVASNVVIGSPDINILTLTELADQVRRIARACALPLLVDADNGFGNTFNVARTIEEIEHAGAAAVTVEDTALPVAFGQDEAEERLIPMEEMLGKLRAAIAARRDREFVIVGRSAALKSEGTEAAAARVKAYAETGVDAIFVTGVRTLEQVAAVREASGLPVIVGQAPASLTHADLAARGARVLLQGHQSVAAVVKALQGVYTHLHSGGSTAELAGRVATAAEMDAVLNVPGYDQARRDYLR